MTQFVKCREIVDGIQTGEFFEIPTCEITRVYAPTKGRPFSTVWNRDGEVFAAMMTPYAIHEKMADTIPAPPGYFAIFLWETEQELSIRLTPIRAWRAGRSLEPITNFASDEYYVRVATLHPDGSVWSEFDDTGDGAEIAVSGMLFDEWLLNRRLEYEAKGLGAPEEMQVRFDFNPDAPEDPLDDRPNLKAGDPADAAEIEREIAMMLARIGVTPPAPASVE